jgi:hypothetical protein
MPAQVSFSPIMSHHDEIIGIDLMFVPSNNTGGQLLLRSESIKDVLPFTAIHEDIGMSVSYGGEESSNSDDSEDESFSVTELMIMDSL